MTHIKKRNLFPVGWLLFFFFGCLMLPPVEATAEMAGAVKIGIVDPVRVVFQSKYGQEARAAFGVEIEEQKKALDKKRETLEKQREKLEKAKQSGKNSALIEKEEKDLEKGIRELKWMKEDFDKELQEMDQALVEKMKDKIRLVLEQFIATTDYCIIMEKQRVAVYCESADVTEEIIKRLDDYKE